MTSMTTTSTTMTTIITTPIMQPPSRLNLRAAYVHVPADAVVSILAIIGLLAGRELGWIWMDPVMGIVGACVIANWSWGLVRAAGATLLDLLPDETLAGRVRARLERGSDRVADLHLWRIGPGHCAAVVSIVSDAPVSLVAYKARLADLPGLSHVTIEVVACPAINRGVFGEEW